MGPNSLMVVYVDPLGAVNFPPATIGVSASSSGLNPKPNSDLPQNRTERTFLGCYEGYSRRNFQIFRRIL